MSDESSKWLEHLARRRAAVATFQAQLPQIRAEGEEALRRLFDVAQQDTGQSGKVARFLLGLYNGPRFPFDMTDLRALDLDLFADCMKVLRMDYQLEKEVHRYFPDGGQAFERMAARWTDDAAAAADRAKSSAA